MPESFLEKLKKGMGLEEPIKEIKEKVEEKKVKPEKPSKMDKSSVERAKKIEIKTTPVEIKVEKKKKPKKVKKTPPIGRKEEKPKAEKVIKKEEVKIKEDLLEAKPSPIIEDKPPLDKAVEDKEKWFQEEGQLTVDVYQTKSDLVIQSAIAGIKPEDLTITIEGDIITIKGEREKPLEESGDYFSQECYWGKFSREIILPVEVDPGRIEASLKEGVLIIRIPKIVRDKKRRIVIKG